MDKYTHATHMLCRFAQPCSCLGSPFTACLLAPPPAQVYAERFRHLKAPRKLHWRPTLGLVELSITVGDSGPLDFKVTPVHAALLMQFADGDGTSSSSSNPGSGGCSIAPAAAGALGRMEVDAGGAAVNSSSSFQQQQLWGAGTGVVSSPQQQQQQPASGGVSKTVSQLSAALGVPVPVVRRKAIFWVSAGVLLERRGAKGEVVYSRATKLDPSRIGTCGVGRVGQGAG